MTTFERVEHRETTTTESVWLGTELTPSRTNRYARSVTRYRVSGAEAVTMYENGRRLYVPVGVVVRVDATEVPNVTVLGSLQRKDGSLGVAVCEIHRYSWWRRGTDWPAWLVEIVADATATGATP